ncbi:bacteriohemerythrin [Pseudodesulfovibrio cashew]|uniref:Bacteriohemerythrin n=1 Tax=Pseudodesulfovibrio cashew TaxID=2678688 RepID=A0A6I6JBU7_9BACT|nr:bacteriohemerythrin [Pseudodesulfovibrio cashew]QGY38628.1 bacteriohemerythrin [Pseudodesulfovibrio cashew]
MPILNWKRSYEVGHDKLDGEHRKLIEMINRAYDAAQEDPDETILAQLSVDMNRYALSHFATEEELMHSYSYPEKESHIAMHENFREKADACGRPDADTIAILRYLSNWLKGHIPGTDKKLARFLREKNIR